MPLDFDHTQEDGTLNAYAFVSATGVVASGAAALTGSYGIAVTTTSGSAAYVTADISDESSHDVNYRFKLDPNTLTMGSSDRFFLLTGRRSAGQACHVIELIYDGANYKLRAGCAEDTGTIVYQDTEHTISDAPHTIEYQMRAASSSSGNDGVLTLFIDGSSVEAKGAYQTFTLSKVADVDLGVTQGGDPGTSGTFYLDDFAGDMTGTYIGLVGNDPTVSGPMTIWTALGYSEPLGTQIIVSDSDSDLSTIRYQCTEALGDITVTLSGAATISLGTNGTHDFTVSGTNADVLATHATAVYVATALGTDAAVTVTATDGTAGTDALTLSIVIADGVIEAATQAEVNAAFTTTTVAMSTTGVETLTLTAVDSGGRTGTSAATITIANPSPPVTDAGLSTVTVTPLTLEATGVAAAVVTVTLRDADGVTLEGHTVTLSDAGAGSTIGAASGASDSEGEVAFAVTSTIAGLFTYTATDATDAVAITQTVDLTFTVPAADAIPLTPNTWPVDLPVMSIAEGWSETPKNTQLRTDMEEGPAKVRRNPNAKAATITFSQLLTGAQTRTLDTFWTATLSGGVLPWEETHPRTLATVTLRFVDRPPLAHVSGDLYRATYTIEVVR